MIKGIILENTFTSISKIAESMFPILSILGPVKELMLRLKWDSLSEVVKITHPLLMVAGEKDGLCPLAMTKELFAAAKKCKFSEFYMVEAGDHNDTFLKGGEEYLRQLNCFMDKCLDETTAVLEAPH